jgi:hypothetical protein
MMDSSCREDSVPFFTRSQGRAHSWRRAFEQESLQLCQAMGRRGGNKQGGSRGGGGGGVPVQYEQAVRGGCLGPYRVLQVVRVVGGDVGRRHVGQRASLHNLCTHEIFGRRGI